MRYVFPIIPASGNATIVVAIIGSLLVALLCLFGYITYSIRHVKFEISNNGLSIRGDFYGRTIPAGDLVIDRARAMNLQTETAYQPSWRTNGIGLPGYISGWFKLTNGEKALAFVTDRTKVVYVPTRDGYAVMMSVADPEQFLRALKTTVTS